MYCSREYQLTSRQSTLIVPLFPALQDCQWSKTRMCPSTHTAWNLLLYTPAVCIPRLPRCFPAHQIWRQTVQLGKIKSSQNNPDLWAAVCRWCCIGRPHSRRASGATQQVLTCLQKFLPYDQHQKDQCHGVKMWIMSWSMAHPWMSWTPSHT